jgi:hypothetical protein
MLAVLCRNFYESRPTKQTAVRQCLIKCFYPELNTAFMCRFPTELHFSAVEMTGQQAPHMPLNLFDIPQKSTVLK